MRQLPREVVQAIETAVEVNDGVLESTFIHSLAKIYKTSPQAVVWNMKRYNKVKAGLDDRQKGGRPAAMDKDEAAKFLRELMEQCYESDEKLTREEIAQKVSEKFGISVSSSWVSRIMSRYNIVLITKPPTPKPPKPPRIPRPPIPPANPDQQAQSSLSTPTSMEPPYRPFPGSQNPSQLPPIFAEAQQHLQQYNAKKPWHADGLYGTMAQSADTAPPSAKRVKAADTRTQMSEPWAGFGIMRLGPGSGGPAPAPLPPDRRPTAPYPTPPPPPPPTAAYYPPVPPIAFPPAPYPPGPYPAAAYPPAWRYPPPHNTQGPYPPRQSSNPPATYLPNPASQMSYVQHPNSYPSRQYRAPSSAYPVAPEYQTPYAPQAPKAPPPAPPMTFVHYDNTREDSVSISSSSSSDSDSELGSDFAEDDELESPSESEDALNKSPEEQAEDNDGADVKKAVPEKIVSEKAVDEDGWETLKVVELPG